VSEVVRTVGGSLAGVEFRDAGRKQLKGIPARQRVYEVVWREEATRRNAAIA
jgi:class 3 adenylate cyclase